MGDLQFTMNTHHYITTLLHHYCSQLTARGSQQKNTSFKTISTLVCYIDKRAQQPRAKSQRQKNIWWFGLESRFIAAGGVIKTSPAPPQNQAILNISNPAVSSYNEL